MEEVSFVLCFDISIGLYRASDSSWCVYSLFAQCTEIRSRSIPSYIRSSQDQEDDKVNGGKNEGWYQSSYQARQTGSTAAGIIGHDIASDIFTLSWKVAVAIGVEDCNNWGFFLLVRAKITARREEGKREEKRREESKAKDVSTGVKNEIKGSQDWDKCDGRLGYIFCFPKLGPRWRPLSAVLDLISGSDRWMTGPKTRRSK